MRMTHLLSFAHTRSRPGTRQPEQWLKGQRLLPGATPLNWPNTAGMTWRLLSGQLLRASCTYRSRIIAVRTPFSTVKVRSNTVMRR